MGIIVTIAGALIAAPALLGGAANADAVWTPASVDGIFSGAERPVRALAKGLHMKGLFAYGRAYYSSFHNSTYRAAGGVGTGMERRPYHRL